MIKERNCNKCIHHISGFCDAWECDMQTLEDYKNTIIDELHCNLIRNSRTEVIDGKICLIVTDKRIKQIAEQMKLKFVHKER